MTEDLFTSLETVSAGERRELAATLAAIHWNQDGLIPAIAQDIATGCVLMQAWMNADSLRETLRTGQVCYWSRSRQRLWRKGESSGNIQQLVTARLDCDGDSLLLLVRQEGVACHTGKMSCYYHLLTADGLQVTPMGDNFSL